MCDPPYKFNNKNTGGSMKSGSANQYPTLSLKQLEIMPIYELSAKDAFLFLWCPASLLNQGIYLMGKWNFEYKTIAFVWDKKTKKGLDHFGMGFYTRQGKEFCLLGIKGKPKVMNHSVRQGESAVNLKHSKKPDIFAKRIVELCGRKKRLELFARDRKKGWMAHGNQVKKPEIKIRWKTRKYDVSGYSNKKQFVYGYDCKIV